MSAVDCLVVIPARGASKGSPRDSLEALRGVPLVAYSIAAAKAAGRVSRVVVTTDDDDIADTAARYGAEIARQSAFLSPNTAASESALLHTLEHLREREGYEPALVALVHYTSPLTTGTDIDGAVRAASQQGIDSCFTAVPVHDALWEHGESGAVSRVPGGGRDLPPYRAGGGVWAMKASAFRAAEDRVCGTSAMHVIPTDRAIEIRHPLDRALAAAALDHLGAALDPRSAALPDPVAALVLDFDGVLTDNRVLVAEDGREAVLCNRGDGMGLNLLRQAGIPRLILSKEPNPVVARRAEKLRIECLHGIDDKPTALARWAEDRGIDLEQVVFVGNDVNDVGCMERVGCAACPADAHPSARAVGNLVLSHDGGHGAVRELCDLILERLR